MQFVFRIYMQQFNMVSPYRIVNNLAYYGVLNPANGINLFVKLKVSEKHQNIIR